MIYVVHPAPDAEDADSSTYTVLKQYRFMRIKVSNGETKRMRSINRGARTHRDAMSQTYDVEGPLL